MQFLIFLQNSVTVPPTKLPLQQYFPLTKIKISDPSENTFLKFLAPTSRLERVHTMSPIAFLTEATKFKLYSYLA